MKPFKISQTQLNKFAKDGFLLLPNAVPKNLVVHWQNLTEKLNPETIHHDNTSALLQNVLIIEEEDKFLLTRYNNLLGVYPNAVLDLMACPAMIAIARDICGKNAAPLQCDLLIKQKCEKSVVLWHQDAIHNRFFPYINIGIYLDDAPIDDGCLKYVAGTQHKAQDICELVKKYGWEIPGALEQPAQAGDILIQDMMVLHGSQIKQKEGARRTVYVEMRPVEGIINQGFQTKEWAKLRQRWMGLVLRRLTSAESAGELNKGIPQDLGTDAEEIAKILRRTEPPVPAAYCYESIRTDVYPFQKKKFNQSIAKTDYKQAKIDPE